MRRSTSLAPPSGASPFASVASTLVANGYSAIPIKPQEKMPGDFKRGEWYVMRDWSRFCNKLPTEFELRHWSGWPDTNVGIACGMGLLAFDIDRDDLVEPILAVLPPCIVAKKGRKGLTVFYAGDTSIIRSRGFSIDKLACMDLISDGKQTVIPPSIHRDTGEPYVWTTPRTLLDTRLDELPAIDESHVEAVIEVLIGFGYRKDDQARFKPIEGGFGVELQDGASAAAEFFRGLNDDALANLHAWVPRLGLQRLSRQGDHYRSVAEWRPSNSGSPLFKRPLLLSIHPKGIVDYGGQEKTYTPLNLVMAAFDLADYQLDKAAVWLGEAIGYDFSAKIVLNRKRKLVDMATPEAAARLVCEAEDDPTHESDGTGMSTAEFGEPQRLNAGARSLVPKSIPGDDEARTPNVVDIGTDFDPSPSEKHDASTDAQFEALTYVPGLVGELVDWIEASAETPNRTLALAAALVFVGTLAGRLYASPSGLRTNLYAIGLAPSGFGKDHARVCLKNLAAKGGLTRFFGGSGIASGSGMRKRVEQQAAILWMIDEFGQFMRQINNIRVPNSYQVRTYLLEYFGTATSTFYGVDYAGEQGTPCHNPNVGLYGTSTPIDFWGSCESVAVADGLLPRMLVFTVDGGDEPPEDVRPTMSREEPPVGLVDGCRRLVKPRGGGNLRGVLATDGAHPYKAQTVPYGAGAEDAYYAHKRAYKLKVHRAERHKELHSRVVENGMKIALVLAIGVDPDRPVLTRDFIDRGIAIAELCASKTLCEISGRLADNDRQREYLDVKRWIVEAGPSGLSRTQLSKRVNGRFDRRRLDDILETLEKDEKAIETKLSDSTRGGPRGARYVAARFLGGVTDDCSYTCKGG